MKKTLAERLRESLRLTVLEHLGRQESRTINERVLRVVLRDMGQETATPVLRGELAWLERQGLIVLRDADSDCAIAVLTERGDLCQRGVTMEPGVERPALA